jgi:hypothetical protein
MRIDALDFLRTGEHGELWSPTRAWAVSRGQARGSDLDAWELVTSAPPADTPALPIHDLKRWMLFDKRDTRFLSLSPKGRKGYTVTRRIPREQAFVRYLNAVRDAVPEAYRSAEITLLIPALDDEVIRKRYLSALREAFPNARVLPEPEMVAEYFRLVRRTLTLDKKRNNVILVIDIGASTSNATIVVSNRGSVIGAETGMRRVGRLQAIQGSCGEIAGQWVDEWLAKRLGIKLEELSATERQSMLEHIEVAKISVSRVPGSASIPATAQGGPYILHTANVHEAALEVVTSLKSVLDKMARRLWAQLTTTDEAKRLSEDVCRERNVDGPDKALRLVDYVVLAGGTSRLPGIREFLESEFSVPMPKFLEIGEDFPIAAAVGALAHVLHDKYSPPRLRTAERQEDGEEAPSLQGALDVDILFAHKPDPPVASDRERTQILLERGDPIIYSGGRRDEAFPIDGPAETQLMARLIPSGAEKVLRRGLAPKPISLKHPSPRVGFAIDTDRRVTLHSASVRQLGSIRLDLDRIGKSEEPSVRPYRGQIPEGTLAIDHADELVIDFGMSKTVVVAVQTGLLDPRLLEIPPGDRAQQVTPVTTPSTILKEPPAAMPPSSPPADEPTHSEALDAANEPADAPPSVETQGQSTRESDSPTNQDPRPSIETPEPSKPEPGPPAPQEPRSPVEIQGAPTQEMVPSILQDYEPVAPELLPEHPACAPAGEVAKPHETGDDLLRGTDGFIESLQAFLTAAEEHGLDVPAADLLFTLLGLSVRPLVFLSGAPGCGKSTLARIVAHLLGRRSGKTFHDVPVQSHWSNDTPLFGDDGLLRRLTDDLERTHLVLFDEVNLTRPEYYLARFFHALEHPNHASDLRIAPTLAIGTLNIDETSRAPSPKVLDRCFLVEMDQVPYDHQLRLRGAHRLGDLPVLSALPPSPERTPPMKDELLDALLHSLDKSVRDNGLREDILPSRRVMGDIGRHSGHSRASG